LPANTYQAPSAFEGLLRCVFFSMPVTVRTEFDAIVKAADATDIVYVANSGNIQGCGPP